MSGYRPVVRRCARAVIGICMMLFRVSDLQRSGFAPPAAGVGQHAPLCIGVGGEFGNGDIGHIVCLVG